ncbi:hypothetical protein CFOL_v3_33069 [Cephalotus follicularis]|uniref:Uncharacterized protein n=1 Tax=Cephalotus follicularis TaxID=3775 RepID=A0A1Q3DB48_CEPFO|nr:hypothetical protein CFOL_v3_33069 [Cephalotus follicularis]
MTTNMINIFNGVLKGALGLPITALEQLSFYRSSSYFVIRRQDNQARPVSGVGFTPTTDVKLHGLCQLAGTYEAVKLHDRPGFLKSIAGQTATEAIPVQESHMGLIWAKYHVPVTSGGSITIRVCTFLILVVHVIFILTVLWPNSI